MARIDVEQSEVIESIVARLKSVLSLADSHCYPVGRPQDVPVLPPGGDYWLTVAPGGGNFADEEQVNGNCTEDAEITVSGYTRVKLDQTNTDRQLLLSDSKGLFKIKKRILRALVGHDAETATQVKNTFLRQWLHARRSEPPDLVDVGRDGVNCGVIRVTFGVIFDWNLTVDPESP